MCTLSVKSLLFNIPLHACAITVCLQKYKTMHATSHAPMQEFGVKGPSWLGHFPAYDIIRGTTVDYMHQLILGVCRQLLNLWLDSVHHQEPWYLGRKETIYELDGRLTSIRPPMEFSRLPRSLANTRKFWKGILLISSVACIYQYYILRYNTSINTILFYST